MFFLLILLAVLGVSGWSAFSQNSGSRTAVVINIKGAIGPAVSDYFVPALENAEKSNTAILILQMDIPGGARTASAGTYILCASYAAAMASTTNLGAVIPIQIAGLPAILKEEQESPEEKEKEEKENDPKDVHLSSPGRWYSS